MLEAEPQLHGVGQGQRHHRGPTAGGDAAGGQLAPGAVGVHGRDAEHVPVDRAVRQQRHGRQEVDLLLGEAVEAARHDELDRGALVLAHGRGQALQLLPAGGARDGTGCPSPSLWVCTCEVEKPSAPSDSAAWSAASMASVSAAVAAPPTARSPMTSRRRVECPTRKPALTAMRPSRRPSHSPKEPQSHGRPGPERGERHPLDARHHPRDVVDVLRRHGRQRESAVAAEHRRHTVQRRGAGIGVPEELRVVVGVQVDEAGRDEHAGGVDHGVGARGVGAGPDPGDALALDHHVGPDRRRAGPVDDGAAPDGDGHARSSCSCGPGRRTRTR